MSPMPGRSWSRSNITLFPNKGMSLSKQSMNMDAFGVETAPMSGESSATSKNAELYLEIFLVDSWAEHLRQHERTIVGDRTIEERVLSHARGHRRCGTW